VRPSTLAPGIAAAAHTTPPPPATEPRRLALNLVYLLAGEFAAKLFTFATFSYLARTLGPRDYGFIEFTLAVMVFFSLPVDLGLGSYGAREIARNLDKAARLLREITGLRMVLALCSIAVLAVFILFLHKSFQLKILLAMYGVSLLGGPFLLQWFFQAHDQMRWVGWASIIRQACFAGLVLLLFRKGAPLLYIGLIECLSVAAVVLFCAYVARTKMGFSLSQPDLQVSHFMHHLKESAPIGLTELAWGFMWYFCTVLLGFLFADATLGWWGASHRALMALHTFVWLYFFNLLPSISRCVAGPNGRLLQLMDYSVRFAAWASLFGAAFLTMTAPAMLSMLYGPSFRAAAGSFAILAWMLPIAMLSGHHRYILVAYNHQRRLLRCTAISAAVAVVLGFTLVPVYGGAGAAWALVIANGVNLLLVYYSVRELIVEVPLRSQITMPLFTLAASMLAYVALLQWSPLFALTGASLVYVIGFAGTDGRRLTAFIRMIARKNAVEALS
jgi:O-antigen/teichoic acid export membrane protein